MRSAVSVLLMAMALLGATGTAFGHAVPVALTPEPGEVLDTAPPRLTVTFNEPVQILRPDDFDVVDSTGASVAATPGAVTADRRVIAIDLNPDLPPGTYTASYTVIGADSHVIPNVHVFGIGINALGPPYLGDGSAGPSLTGPWGVSARLVVILALGGMLGLLAARWLVWGVAWRRPPSLEVRERAALLKWWRDGYWTAFGALAVIAMVAHGYALVVQAARTLGVSAWAAAGDMAGIGDVLARTDFGSQTQLRGALLFSLFVVATVASVREYSRGPSVAATANPLLSLVMVGLVLAALASIAGQGHARVADSPWLQIASQLTHTAGAAIWMTGFVIVIALAARAPAVAPGGGPALTIRVLKTFSLVATITIVMVIATGLVRSVAELGGIAELWNTAYGRSILYKTGLLLPLVAVALYNRRILVALRIVDEPPAGTLRLVRRTATCELAFALMIVLVAEILVAQAPGVA